MNTHVKYIILLTARPRRLKFPFRRGHKRYNNIVLISFNVWKSFFFRLAMMLVRPNPTNILKTVYIIRTPPKLIVV